MFEKYELIPCSRHNSEWISDARIGMVATSECNALLPPTEHLAESTETRDSAHTVGVVDRTGPRATNVFISLRGVGADCLTFVGMVEINGWFRYIGPSTAEDESQRPLR
jgi:hypothetical protein